MLAGNSLSLVLVLELLLAVLLACCLESTMVWLSISVGGVAMGDAGFADGVMSNEMNCRWYY